MKLKYLKAALVSCFLVVSSFANAGLMNNLNEHDGSGLSINNNPGANWSRGWVFNVNTNDIWITQLGLHTPEVNNSNYSISLWDVSTQSLLTSTLASDTSNSWNWFDITPFELLNGEQYLISLHINGNSSYYYGNDPLLQPSGDIEYVNMQYCNGCSDNTFPTSNLTNLNYGLVDFSYQIGEPLTAVPEPSTLAIFALGMIGLASRRFKKQP